MRRWTVTAMMLGVLLIAREGTGAWPRVAKTVRDRDVNPQVTIANHVYLWNLPEDYPGAQVRNSSRESRALRESLEKLERDLPPSGTYLILDGEVVRSDHRRPAAAATGATGLEESLKKLERDARPQGDGSGPEVGIVPADRLRPAAKAAGTPFSTLSKELREEVERIVRRQEQEEIERKRKLRNTTGGAEDDAATRSRPAK